MDLNTLRALRSILAGFRVLAAESASAGRRMAPIIRSLAVQIDTIEEDLHIAAHLHARAAEGPEPPIHHPV